LSTSRIELYMTSTNSTPPATSTTINVDHIGRVHLGTLRTNSQHYPAAGERYLEQLKTTALTAVVRRGKDNQWFAALENRQGEAVAFSEDLGSENAARNAGASALAMLKSRTNK